MAYSSAFTYGFTYDVFISFRGIDTRYGFTGNLYRALCDKGISTFMDVMELERGDEIKSSLINAIEGSRIFIPVFSINYASSSFCLDELAHIIHCYKAKGRLVLPVFYGVDPSLIRHVTGAYGEAIAKHEEGFQSNKEKYRGNLDRLQKWKMALNQAANLSGHHFSLGKEYEYETIVKIVSEVSNKINRAPLHVADYPVGLGPRLLKVNSLLDVGSYADGVGMVGIHGIGGIGKTTLAQAVYNFIADQFEGLCFIHNVRENSTKHGLEHLQEKLLSKTIGSSVKFGDVSEGIPGIKQRLCRKKILLILDDVDKLKQLQVLVGGLDWFGFGSRVIITTRDKHLLASHGIKRTYEVDELTVKEALELLKWKAFKSNKVDSSFEPILKRAVTYASGLPLALEIVGSNLFGKNIEEWKSILDRYERIPNKEIQKILKVSFDAMEEDEQSVFLNIACCFKGCQLAEVEHILCAHHGQSMEYHIGVLVEKSLIKISQSDPVILVHDLIEEIGKEIVRQESPKDPGKRSRLWFHEDIIHVLGENTGTSQIEIIYLNFPLFKEEVVEWKGDELKKMENLKTLIIKSGHFSKGPEHLPNSLRVLEWNRYPSQDIPSDFCAFKLSICKLRRSCLTSFELSSSVKRFMNMRELILDNCQFLTRIHDVSGLPNLEIFSFHNCWNLVAIHHSIGLLNKLKTLVAYGCNKLTSFPPMKLTSLQRLELSKCNSLKSFPEILEKMENIKELELAFTSIKELPRSFQNLTRLRKLQLGGNGKLRLRSSILRMPNLSSIYAWYCLLPKQNENFSSVVSSNVQVLKLPNCNLSDEFLQISLAWFSNVQKLDLSRNNFTILPEHIKECRFLRSLNLDDCKRLREIRGVPPNLKYLSALRCKSLTSLCRSMLLNQELHEAGSTEFCLDGLTRIPEWFEHQNSGPSICFWFRNKIPSIALFFVSQSMNIKFRNSELVQLRAYLSINGYKYALDNPLSGVGIYLQIKLDRTYLCDMKLGGRKLRYQLVEALLEKEWIHAEITFESENAIPILKNCGIHVFKKKSSMEDIQFTNPSDQSQNTPLVENH